MSEREFRGPVKSAFECASQNLRAVPELRMLIESRALFQEWIFGGQALRKMKRIVREAKP